jgi:hypothetical protein
MASTLDIDRLTTEELRRRYNRAADSRRVNCAAYLLGPLDCPYE